MSKSNRFLPPVDLDNDLDPDLAVAAEDDVIGPAIQILQNIGTQVGEVAFSTPVSFGVDADPQFVLNADFNLDELQDLVTANEDELPGSGSVTVLLNTPPPCPADLDGGGSVGIVDFLMLLGAWGPCLDCSDCPADLDNDCTVGIIDFLQLLANWGSCT